MSRYILPLLALLASVSVGGRARADEQADYVFSRAAYALGGREKLAQVRGLKLTWHDHAGMGAGRTTFLDFVKGRMRMEWWKPGLTYGWTLNPKGGWAYQNDRVRPMTAVEVREARSEFRLRGFAFYLGPVDSVEALSLEDRRTGDKRDHVIKLSFSGGWVRRLIFDGESYYLRSIESGPDSAREVETLDDYRDVGDFFLAHRETRRAPGGEILEDYDLSVSQSKPVFTDADFLPPVPLPRHRSPRHSRREKP